MKRIILVFSILLCSIPVSYGQVISVKADAFPIFPNVHEEETKVLKYIGPFSMIYIDSLDSTFLCETRDFNYFNVNYSAFVKCPIPNNSKISDMYTPDFFYMWVCGKDGLSGKGLYSFLSPSNLSMYPQTFSMFYLPDMHELKKMTVANIGTYPPDLRMFAIGTTEEENNRHILDLNVMGSGYYPTLPYDYATVDSTEYLDDLELVESYVVFATRDVGPKNINVNLRVMDIWNGLSNTDIDVKWRFVMPTDETIYGKVFVEYLEESCFEVCYIKYSVKDGYVLCLHRINLVDMLFGITNTIISQEISIEKGVFIQDIVYDRVERVLIILMDNNLSNSVFLHTVPDKNYNYNVVRLESAINERYFSIDTMASYSNNPGRMYQAWGGTKCFEQRFATDGTIMGSCISDIKIESKHVDPIRIKSIDNPIPRKVGDRYHYWEQESLESNVIWSNCFENEDKSINK